MDDYSKLDTPNEYIISLTPDSPEQKPPTNWLKTGLIIVGAVIVLGGTGSAFYLIKTTTDSVSKAAKTQQDAINEIINDDPSFSLISKVEAGYEDPFTPSTEESNPFIESSNPFDEIGY